MCSQAGWGGSSPGRRRKGGRPMSAQSGADWLTQFFQYLTGERGYSSHTISAYELDLKQFRKALVKDLLQGTTDDIRNFILSFLETVASPKTARRKLSVIKGFYGFVFAEGGISKDPSKHIRGPKAFRSIVRPITRAEVDQILASLGTDHPLDLRNRALVYTAYGSGLRVSEAVKLRITDLDFRKAVAKVKLGKGQKDRLVPLNQPEIEAIRLYLERARPKFATEPENGVLFIGRRGEPLTRQRVWQILTRMSLPVVGRRISPHKYRHAFVTDTINGGAASRVVQKMVGHVSVTTTMDYMHSDVERVRTEYLRAHPRGASL
jgi:site-specific recombinase XerD